MSSNHPSGADREFGFGTRAIHAGAQPDPVTGARATPIHQTTSFVFDTGDHIVAASTLYGGTVGQLGVGFGRLGIETTFVDPADPENFARAMRPNTRALYGETIGNPLVNVLDIAAVAEVAHAHGVPLIIDNTVASPYLCNPLALGA